MDNWFFWENNEFFTKGLYNLFTRWINPNPALCINPSLGNRYCSAFFTTYNFKNSFIMTIRAVFPYFFTDCFLFACSNSLNFPKLKRVVFRMVPNRHIISFRSTFASIAHQLWCKIAQVKIFLFIDGTNLYAGQYELFGPKRYMDFPKFIELVQSKLKIKFNRIYFYASYSPKPKRLAGKINLYLKNEALFYRGVRKTKDLTFFRGYRSKTSGKEKEVDVKLAVEIVHFAHLNKFDSLYLFSGDADFMHALKIAESLKKQIEVIALENRIPNRFSYIYKTNILIFSKPILKTLPSQKIKIISVRSEELTKSV